MKTKVLKRASVMFLALMLLLSSMSLTTITTVRADEDTSEVVAEEVVTAAEDIAPVETEAPAEPMYVEETQEVFDAPAATEEAAAETTAETTAKTETEEETKEETETAYPAASFSGAAGGVEVFVAADEGTFPEGTTMTVIGVSASQVYDVANAAVAGEVTNVKAVDITFYGPNGQEVQPLKNVHMTMNVPGMNQSANKSVIHIADNGAANVVANASVVGDNAYVEAGSFSIYAIVDEGTVDDEARLTVNFVQADGTKVSMMINKRQLDQIELYIYDPGVGTIPEGATFMGWTDVEAYTAEGLSGDNPAMTIADVRSEVATLLNGNTVKEGDEVTFYAMVFYSYIVTFLDEEGITIKNDMKLYRVSDTATHNYEVNQPYTPYVRSEDEEAGITALFAGWQQIIPQVEGAEIIYQNGDSFELTSDVTLRATVKKGYWISFNENMAGADFTQPQLVAAGENPTEPDDPTCAGYTFDGWYTEDDSDARDGKVKGDEVNFDTLTLTKNTTVHAKWTEKAQAAYSVIIWKQKVSGEGYDFEESVKVNNAAVGTVINTVTAQGTGDNRYARVNGVNKRYEGFHLKEFDENVIIKSDGTTVLNVYYDRNEITLTFQYRQNNRWQTQITMTGLYGQTLASQGYEWPTNRWWYDDYDVSLIGVYSGAGTRTTFLDAFILSDGSSEQTFYGFAGNGNRTVHFLQQNANGNGYTEVHTVSTANGTFNISDKFSGFHAAQYSTNNYTWTNLNGKDSDGYYAAVSNYTNLYIRFNRNNYSILFKDGIYATATDPERYNKTTDVLGEVDNIRFGANVSSYRDYDETQLQQEMHNYVFMGWYADDQCTTLYDFTTMPEGGITVYAKWLKKEYEVILHPLDSEADPIQYNSESQEEEFWVENGEKVANVGGERIYYDLAGWFADEGFTKSYDFDLFALNDTIIESLGHMYSESEIDPEYPNTVGELNLYAKWRSKLIGANGVKVIYDATTEGSNAPEDPHYYVDLAEAIAGAAATSTNEDKVFSHWVVQAWNGSAFTDTSVKVFPGDTFVVKADDARIKDENGNPVSKSELDKNKTYTYEVQLKAVYVEKDKETTTSMKWYYNYTGAPDSGLYAESTKLKINQAVDVPDAPTRDGYKFLGWIRGVEETAASTTSADHVTTLTDLYITYDDASSSYDHEQVAADEALVNESAVIGSGDAYIYHHAMYAKWEPIMYTVVYTDGVDTEVVFEDQETENLKEGDDTPVFNEGTDPTREGYVFDGWSPEFKDKVSAADADDDNVITYTAQWARQYTLTYEYTGTVPEGAPEVPAQATYKEGASIKPADVPTLTGYTFNGWNNEPTTMPPNDVTVSGSWTINTHKVTYEYTGDVPENAPEVPAEATYEYGATVPPADVPTLDGYTFSGWTGEVTTMPDEDVIVTGSWTLNQFKITYKLNGGIFDGSTDDIVEYYVPETEIKIHEAPTREGYTFKYWEGSEYYPGDDYTVMDDHTFTAVWEKNAEPEEETTPEGGSEVKTGDSSNMALFIMLGVAALAAIIFALKKLLGQTK